MGAAVALLLILSCILPGAARATQKPRVVVTTDPELDDANSLIRYLLYSTDFRTEGLIYASSGFHWKGDGTGKKVSVPNREYSRWGLNLCPCASWRWAPDEQFIDRAVATYEQVYPNLRVHDSSYPAPAELRSKIRWGNVEFDGDISKDTPGSDLIKALLLDDEPGPVYLLAWGGQSTIARALKSIQEQYSATPQWAAVYQKVSHKAILSPSGDQDDTYATYIHPNWPDIGILPAGVGGVPLGYEGQATVSAEDSVYYSTEWTRANISSRGAFGALYRVWGDGKQMVQGDIFDYFGLSGFTASQLKAKGYIVWTPPRPKGAFLGEGDTFTYLNLIDNGLQRDGWGGHGAGAATAATGQRPLQQITINSYDDLLRLQEMASARPRPPSPDPDFIPAAQNDFAARLAWSVTSADAGANHPPTVAIRGSSRISAHAGETVRLEGAVSDPDGNAVAPRWWQWKEAGTYPGVITITNPTALTASVQIPSDAAAGQTIHLVLAATDNGAPALTRYQRVIVSVQTPAPPRPVLIRGALVVDGSGGPSRMADVRIVGGTVRQIGRLSASSGDSVVDAHGLVLAPGFIDTHSHHDRGLAKERTALGAVSQGITTIVVGQDGWSNFPLADWLAQMEQRPAAVNVASYVGHGRLRDVIMGDDFKRQATPAEVRYMAALLDGEMAAGALGLSSGLEYDPGIYSATDELVALARVAARHGGRYISHVRSEDRHFWAAIDELITIGRRAGLPVQLSHAKLAMRSVWGRADSLIGILNRARASGVRVTLDIYPYTYWQSTLTVLFPERNFQDTAAARFALTEVTTPDSAILGDFEPDTTLAGKSIAEISALRHTEPAVTLMDLIAEAGKPKPDGGSYDESVVAVSMVQPDIDRLWRWPFANVSSDGALNGAHPRGFGAFPRFYRMAVRERHLLSLTEAVRRMTSLAAANVGIANRGRIAPGMFADLVLLDTAALADRATPKEPHVTATGVRAVWVNGVVVYNGAVTGVFPGRVIRRNTAR